MECHSCLKPWNLFSKRLFFRKKGIVLGGSGSVIESDGLDNLRAALIFSQHQAVLLRWDFSIFQGSCVSAHVEYYSVVIIFHLQFSFFELFFISGFLKLLVSMMKLQRMCVQCRDFDSGRTWYFDMYFAGLV